MPLNPAEGTAGICYGVSLTYFVLLIEDGAQCYMAGIHNQFCYLVWIKVHHGGATGQTVFDYC